MLHQGCRHQSGPLVQQEARNATKALLPPCLQVLASNQEREVVTMAMRNWIVGYIFDAWTGARVALNEFYESVDRALDCWGDDDE